MRTEEVVKLQNKISNNYHGFASYSDNCILEKSFKSSENDSKSYLKQIATYFKSPNKFRLDWTCDNSNNYSYSVIMDGEKILRLSNKKWTEQKNLVEAFKATDKQDDVLDHVVLIIGSLLPLTQLSSQNLFSSGDVSYLGEEEVNSEKCLRMKVSINPLQDYCFWISSEKLLIREIQRNRVVNPKGIKKVLERRGIIDGSKLSAIEEELFSNPVMQSNKTLSISDIKVNLDIPLEIFEKKSHEKLRL